MSKKDAMYFVAWLFIMIALFTFVFSEGCGPRATLGFRDSGRVDAGDQ